MPREVFAIYSIISYKLKVLLAMDSEGVSKDFCSIPFPNTRNSKFSAFSIA